MHSPSTVAVEASIGLRHDTIYLHGVCKVVFDNDYFLLGLASIEPVDTRRAASDSVAVHGVDHSFCGFIDLSDLSAITNAERLDFSADAVGAAGGGQQGWWLRAQRRTPVRWIAP